MSATQGIKKLLESGESITPVEALAVFGVIRLGSIIFVLRQKGMTIETEMRNDSRGHSYARYKLGKEAAVAQYRTNEHAEPWFKEGTIVEVARPDQPFDPECSLFKQVSKGEQYDDGRWFLGSHAYELITDK